jgi:hypothetical protein
MVINMYGEKTKSFECGICKTDTQSDNSQKEEDE